MAKQTSSSQARYYFDFFYGDEASAFAFYRIPKMLFTHEPFCSSMASEAKLLYGLLLDRVSLSRKNNWLDDQNRCYVIYTIQSVCKDLGCATEKATKLMKSLEQIGLLTRKKRGLGLPDIIYVHNFASAIRIDGDDAFTDVIKKDASLPPDETSVNQNFSISKIDSPENGKSNFQDFVLPNPLNSDFRVAETGLSESNNNNINNTDKNNNPSYLSEAEIDGYIALIKENVEYGRALSTLKPEDMEMFDELVDLICDVVCIKRPFIKISGTDYPYEIVKNRFLRLRYAHLEYVIYSMRVNITHISNIRAYLLTALYHSLSTMRHFYQSEVNHTLFGDQPDA